MNIKHAANPTIDDTPTSCHIKYVATIVCTGLIHKKCKNINAESNLFTSFDKRFTTWPIVVLPRAFLLNRKAYTLNT